MNKHPVRHNYFYQFLRSISFCLLIMLALSACAKKIPVEETGGQSLATRWRTMLAASQNGVTGPWRMQLSLRFGEEGDTRRVTGIMWGNDEHKLRLDVMAGVGAVIAKIFEDGRHFMVYAQQENKAYFHDGPNKPLFKVGVPVPFDLSQLAELLNGNYTAVFGANHGKMEMLSGGNAVYELNNGPGGALELAPSGLPVEWKQGGNGWTMQIIHNDEEPFLPRRLNLSRSNGQMAVILVKERELSLPAFTEDQINLTLPAGVPTLPLSAYKPS